MRGLLYGPDAVLALAFKDPELKAACLQAYNSWLAEEFCVYAGTIKVSLPVTLTEEGGDQTLQVTVHYQACSESDCFIPQTLKLALPVQAADHIGRLLNN